MRGISGILITALIAIVIALLYFFLGRAQVVTAIDKLRTDNAKLEQELAKIRTMAVEIPQMAAELPRWRKQLVLFKQAIPEQIDDEKFLASVNEELKRTGVQLLGIEVVKGGGWLASATQEQLEQLRSMGLDVDVASKIQVAFYSVSLIGDFDKIISAFEHLKQHHRLYSIDQVSGPAPGAGGTITANIDPVNTPIQITGKLYSGIPAGFMSIEALDEVYTHAVAVPVTRRIKQGISSGARKLVTAAGGAEKPAAGGGGAR